MSSKCRNAAHARAGSPHETVPIFVPTPRIDAFRAVASQGARLGRNSLKTSNLAQLLAMGKIPCKLLILRGFLASKQRVAGSSPAAPTNFFN
jgi:hypothetical protein